MNALLRLAIAAGAVVAVMLYSRIAREYRLKSRTKPPSEYEPTDE